MAAAANNHEELLPILKQRIQDHVIDTIESSRGYIPNSGSFNSNLNTEGAFSSVSGFKKTYKKRKGQSKTQKYAIRISKVPVLVYTDTKSKPIYLPHDSIQSYNSSTNFDDLNKSHEMWSEADKYELSPKLHKYLYVSNDEANQSYHLVIINEKFTYTVEEFYKTDYTYLSPKKQNEINKIISDKIYYLIVDTVTKMKVVSYDVKPSNSVIQFKDGDIQNISSDNIEVKFIDWDADWCRKLHNIPNYSEDLGECIEWLMVMMMNLHFITYLKINLFYESFKDFEDFFIDNKEIMINIFFDNNYYFKFMADHYFFNSGVETTRPKRNKFIVLDPTKFNTIFNLCTKLKTISEPTEPPPIIPSPQSAESNTGFSFFELPIMPRLSRGGKKKSKKVKKTKQKKTNKKK